MANRPPGPVTDLDRSVLFLATAFANKLSKGASRRLKKVPVQTGVCYGFVGNRMLHRRTYESEMLLIEGA